MNDPLRCLSKTLINEAGMPGCGVAITRRGAPTNYWSGTVGEFLSDPANQSGDWFIDGGWGGPPGPIGVRWNEVDHAWENGGFCGYGFAPEPTPAPAPQVIVRGWGV